MAETARRRSEAWSELLTPEALSQDGHLAAAAPAGEFDPRGQWTQRWRIFLLQRTTRENTHGGHIEITRQPEGRRVRLTVRQANIQGPQLSKKPIEGHDCQDGVWLSSVCDSEADVLCLDDRCLTPESWTLRSVMRCTKGKAFEGTRLTKRMRLRPGEIEQTCQGRTSVRAVPTGDVTSNWGLLNVLSTLDTRRPPAFTLLDELDKVKTGHRLYPAPDGRIDFGGRAVDVRCYHQIGTGSLPWTYYVDASTRRVLLAISGLRAYILDDRAAEMTATRFAGFVEAGRTPS